MNRREAIRAAALMMGGMVISPSLARALNNPNWEPSTSLPDWATASAESLLAEVCDTIIPTTTSPGAKAANVHQFIFLMLKDCYSPAEQSAFAEQLSAIETAAQNQFKTNFESLDTAKRTDILKQFEAAKVGGNAFNFWRTLKELTMFGYFTSEIGATQALRYEWVPGRYNGDVTIDPKTAKLWAN
ncbi:MAG: hypothetical protein RL757_449 [Bacteroidota bacterium]|jgi:hypothetical protein